MKKILKTNYQLVVFLVSILFLGVSLLNANNDSTTFDEVAHIPAGYSYLTEHDMRLNPEHPPLLKNLAALPLLFMDINFDTTQEFWTEKVNGQWAAGRHLLWEAGNNPDKIIFWARVPIIIISLLLGLFIFKWTKELAGTLAGLLAFTFYSFDPNILGHNHYVTTDIGVMAFLTFSFYYFIQFIKKPTWKNTFLGGFFWGLLHLAKFSSIVTLPIFGLVLIGYPLIKKINLKKTTRIKTWFEYLGKGIVAFTFSMLLVWAYYIPNTYKMPAENFAKTVDFYFTSDDSNIKSVKTREVLFALNKSDLTRPMAEYVLGMGMVFKRVAGGNGAYFMGEVSDNAFPAYFPTVFLIKETIPFLVLILLTSFFAISQIINTLKHTPKPLLRNVRKKLLDWLQHRVTQYTLFGFIVLYTYLSVTGNLNIGLRHLFPIFPFIYILVAEKIISLFACLKKSACKHKKLAILYSKYLLTFLIIWIIAEPVMSYPYYLSYFNQAVGGPKNGYHYVTDSNADWGQDLKRLKKFLDKNPGIDKIHVDYFGGGNPPYYLGSKYLQWWDSKRPLEPGWYAVSTNFLQGSIYDTRLKPDGTPRKPDNESWRWVQDLKPTHQIGTSIFIYYLEK